MFRVPWESLKPLWTVPALPLLLACAASAAAVDGPAPALGPNG
jgi:hypothetical protein